VIGNPLLLGDEGGYNLTRSLRFRSSASAYLNRTFGTPTSGTTWTWSGWVKRGILTNGTGTAQQLFSAGSATAFFRFSSTDTLLSGWTGASNLETTAVYRDPAAWYHIMLVVDTTQATAANRVKYYVNGVQVTAFATTDYPTQNSSTTINSAVAHNIAAYTSSTQFFDGYLAEVNFIDGQALTPSSFGAFSIYNQWLPKKYAGTYGTNGFYLPFTNNASAATLGNDFSGNGNTWTTNNISVTAGSTYDSMTDVPTLTSATAANYAVMNPLSATSPTIISNGNLQVNISGSSSAAIRGSIAVISGKWYWEATAGSFVTANTFMVGVANSNVAITAASWITANAWSYYGSNGEKYNAGTSSAYGATYTTGDVIGIALDMDNGTLTFYKNGTSQGQAFSGLTGKSLMPTMGTGLYALTFNFNFGQQPFVYTPPSGFVALNTFNL